MTRMTRLGGLAAAAVIAGWTGGVAAEVHEIEGFTFESGATLEVMQVGYDTHGTLSEARDNAILITHGTSGDRHGYDDYIGPGLAFDTERYGTLRMWQERRGTGQGVATELGPIDFAAIARACGARGARVERDAEFEPALRQALAADRPTVIQLALDRAWVSVDETPAG